VTKKRRRYGTKEPASRLQEKENAFDLSNAIEQDEDKSILFNQIKIRSEL